MALVPPNPPNGDFLDSLTRQLQELDDQVPGVPDPQPGGAPPPIPVGQPGGFRPPQAVSVPDTIFNRITGAAGAGFERVAGPDPSPGEGKPISTIGELGSAVVKAAGGAFGAVFSGIEQTLIETGVSKTSARKLSRDAFALLEGTIPLSVGSPGSVLAAERGIRRRVVQTERKEKFQAMLGERKAQLKEDAATNLLARETREKARAAAIRGGKSETDADLVAADAAGQLDLALEKTTRDTADALLRAPDEILDLIPATETTVLNLEIQARAVDLARNILAQRGIDPTGLAPQRVQVLIMDLLTTDRGVASAFKLELEAAGFDDIFEFAEAFITTGKEASATLNLRRRLFNKARRDALFADKGATARGARDFLERAEGALDEATGLISPFEQAELLSTQLPRMFRKLLVSLPATAARNAIDSGLFRITLDSMQRMVEVSLQRVFSPGTPRLTADPFGDLGRIFGSGAAVNKAQVQRLIDAFPEVGRKVFSSLEADFRLQNKVRSGAPITKLDKSEAFIDRFLLALNRGQEMVIRTAILGGSLDRRLRRVNSSLDEMFATKQLPAGFQRALGESMFDSLFMTFALRAETGSQRLLTNLFGNYAGLIEASRIGPYMEPFPNFIFNATRLIMESTTSGFLRLTRPINRAKFANGDMNPLAREVVGAGLFATAVAMRTGNFPGMTPGARYDEFLLEDGTRISMAPFATIIPSLFIADFALRLNEGRLSDDATSFRELRRGLLSSAPQVEFASSAIQDAIKGLTGIRGNAEFTEKLRELLGNTATGALRPLQAIRAVAAEVSEEYEKLRELKGQGGLAPIQNILLPQGSEALGIPALPERESPIKGPVGRVPRVDVKLKGKVPGIAGLLPDFSVGGQLVSQISGGLLREKRTPFARQVVRLGFSAADLSPKTGNPRLNALVSRFSGPLAERAGNIAVTSAAWQHLGVKTQKKLIRDILVVSRQAGLQIADQLTPAGAIERRLRKLSRTEFNSAVERINRVLGNQTSVQEIFDMIREQVNIELSEEGL